MAYQTAHKATEGYKLIVMWLLIGAFLVALPFMFIHPGITILLLWVGLVVIGIGTMIGRALRKVEQSAARHDLARHRCPECGAEFQDEGGLRPTTCDKCGAVFAKTAAT